MENNCPICTKVSIPVAKITDGELLKCPECHWLFSTSTPKAFVKKDLGQEKRDEYLAITQKATLLSGLSGGDKVLDICSGDGMLLGWYLKSTITVGVEPDAALMKEALNNKRIDHPVIQDPTKFGDLNQLGKFKIITIVDVIQNMDFLAMIQKAMNLLHLEGVLVVQTPYFPQEITEKIIPSRNYLLTYTLRNVFQRVGLELQGVEFTKTGVRVYVTFNTFKKFGINDFDLKLRLYTQMSHAIITELHARFDLNETYAKIADSERSERRNVFAPSES